MDKGRQAVQKLYSETKCQENNLRLMKCDLCSFESIRKFANLYNNEEERLDVLICNAGLSWSPDFITKDGFNSVIQANYLGHFLLTNLLRDKLRQSRPSRIVNVSSRAHRSLYESNIQIYSKQLFSSINKGYRSIDWSDAFTQYKTSRLFGVYPASKALQILSTYKLKQDLLGR